jgi:hypothetical protein
MSFTVKANCQNGSQLIHRRKSPEAALKKARELLKICYEVHIITPEGRDYASSEFGDIPRTPHVLQAFVKPSLSHRLLVVSGFMGLARFAETALSLPKIISSVHVVWRQREESLPHQPAPSLHEAERDLTSLHHLQEVEPVRLGAAPGHVPEQMHTQVLGRHL